MTAIAHLTRSVLQLGMAPVRTVKERVSAGGSNLVDDLRDEFRQVIDAALSPVSAKVGQTEKTMQQVQKDLSVVRDEVDGVGSLDTTLKQLKNDVAKLRKDVDQLRTTQAADTAKKKSP